MSEQTKIKLIDTSEVLKSAPDNIKKMFANRLNLNEDIDSQIASFESDVNLASGKSKSESKGSEDISDSDLDQVMRSI
ncbi:hypothetical protein MG290_14730 (plasmid) [Flavobacterium sp. CBA20B-1]|uniref:hypothetical protein n=1 Tax=unclassified Flavobacterium TaxID=196869 RepID=UPI002223EEFB|nr:MULTISPECIES: hypothetical protein [unclassified Flavobacterium]WCM43617.1 hypothetical protein MG290_14730 [Flavobacterium sp. CBA20B-1]